MKWCKHCNVQKPLEEFVIDRASKDGFWHTCKRCCRAASARRYSENPGRSIAASASWNKRNPERYKDNLLRSMYGITLATYNSMLLAQNGVCAICGKTSEKALSVDHDEMTGRVRGLLCGLCNRGIGHFQHSPQTLEKAAAYLRNCIGSPSQTPSLEAGRVVGTDVDRYPSDKKVQKEDAGDQPHDMPAFEPPERPSPPL